MVKNSDCWSCCAHILYIYRYRYIDSIGCIHRIINHPMIVRFVTQWLASTMAAPWVAHLRCVERDPTLFRGVSKASCPEKPKDMPVLNEKGNKNKLAFNHFSEISRRSCFFCQQKLGFNLWKLEISSDICCLKTTFSISPASMQQCIQTHPIPSVPSSVASPSRAPGGLPGHELCALGFGAPFAFSRRSNLEPQDGAGGL